MNIAKLVATGLVCLTAASSWAVEEPPQPKRQNVKTVPGVRAFNAVSGLRHDVQAKCAADVKNNWDAQFAKLAEDVEKIPNPAEKEVVKEYLDDLHAWQLVRQKGVPDVGTWDEVRAKIEEWKPLLDTKMPGIDNMQGIIDTAAKISAARAQLQKVDGYFATKLANCGDMISPKVRFDLNRGLTNLVEDANKKVYDLLADLKREKLGPFIHLTKRLAELKDLTQWDNHATWVKHAMEIVGRANELVAMEAQLTKVQEYTESDDADGPGNALAEAKKQLAALQPILAKRLSEVGFPKAPGKDPARDKSIKSFLEKDDKIMAGPGYLTGVSKQSFDETDPKDHLRHRVERQIGNGYVVVKPAKWPHIGPPELTKDLCEIQWFNFFKYTAAGPSHQKNVWLVNMEGGGRWHRYTAPILCKNAKTPSKLK